MAIDVLFLCNDNSSRSIMAEALLKRFGSGRFGAFSAGIAPAAAVHPLAQEMLNAAGLDVPRGQPKNVSEFLLPPHPRLIW